MNCYLKEYDVNSPGAFKFCPPEGNPDIELKSVPPPPPPRDNSVCSIAIHLSPLRGLEDQASVLQMVHPFRWRRLRSGYSSVV